MPIVYKMKTRFYSSPILAKLSPARCGGLGLLYVLGSLTVSAALRWESLEQAREPATGATVVEVPFTFTNEGSDVVTITEVKPSCGCTVAALAKKEFAPGEKGDVRAVFTIGARKGPQQIKLIVLTSDAPKTPTVLSLKVTLPGVEDAPAPMGGRAGEPGAPFSPHTPLMPPTPLPTVTASESSLFWKSGEVNSEKTITITTTEGAQVVFDPLVPFMAQLLSVNLEPTDVDGEYKLKIKPMERSGSQNQMLLLRVLDAAKKPMQSLVINVRVDG